MSCIFALRQYDSIYNVQLRSDNGFIIIKLYYYNGFIIGLISFDLIRLVK